MKRKNTAGFSMILVVLLMVIVAGVGLFFYFRSKTKSTAEEIGAEMMGYKKVGKDTYEVSNENGTTIIGEDIKKIPEDFPKDLPIYKKGNLTSIHANPPESGAYTMDIKGDIKPVLAWYKSEFEKNGWKIDLDDETGINVSKGDLIGGVVVIEMEEGVYSLTCSATNIDATGFTQEGYDDAIELNQELQGE